MKAKLLFKKSQKMYEDLEKTLLEIELNLKNEKIIRYENSLMEIDEAIRKLKSEVVQFEFLSIADEIYFFKEIKPLFVAKFIYFSRLLSIEATKPNAGEYILKEYYECELKTLKKFSDENTEFYD